VTLPIVTVGSASSLVIVPVPTPVPEIAAFDGLARLTVNVSVASTAVSPFTETTTCFAVCPAAKVSVPDVAV
jgi:hypothetical protein